MKRLITVAALVFAAIIAALSFTSIGIADDQPIIGSPAPEFELPDQTGQLHSLEDYRNQWVVLYFYLRVSR
jgi:peroxiredoxin Q/BCP